MPKAIEDSRQIFIFKLDGEEYAIEIDNVREIIKSGEKEITNIPNVPDFITGITNVRGQVVPVLNLERKFNLSENENNYIVIVELNDTPAGLLVDDVTEVMKIDEKKVKEAPEILEQEIHRKYVRDVAVLDKRMIIILALKAGLEEHEEIAVEQIKDTMEDDEEDEEEEVTSGDVKEAAMDRLDDAEKNESKPDEKDTESKEEETAEESEEEESESEEKDTDQDEEDSGELECDECGKGFDSKRSLASHKAKNH